MEMVPADERTIQPGSQVVMHYSIILEDGTIADTSEDEPIEFVMGDGTLIEGLELALYGLKEGDTQSLQIDPHNAFGFPDEENVHHMPREDFDVKMDLDSGLIIEFTTPSGDAVPGAIIEVKDKDIVVDFNHPLAGHTITFNVEILDVQAGSAPVGSA
ncbi:MAG: peptidylprolyl isomerase [Gammaproteobacteria bacterium]|nr:MAG: peptidylprolyl isomerase [Gammaproteobacteria bacterium]